MVKNIGHRDNSLSQTEEELRRTRLFLKASLDIPKNRIVFSVDKNFRYLFFNNAHKTEMQRIYGTDVAIGTNSLDCVTEESARKKLRIRCDRAFAGESHSAIDEYGDPVHSRHESFFNPLFDETKMVIGVTVFVLDITERKHAEEALRESEEKFSLIFNSAPYAITITRPKDGRFIQVNDAFSVISGFSREEALDGSSVALNVWADENDRNQVVRDLASGKQVTGREFQFRKKNGEIITGLFSANVLTLKNEPVIVSSINDISDKKRTEKALQNTQKLESLGLLAGGIAHDFNNLMGGIFGYIDLAAVCSKDPIVSEYLEKAMNTIDRARGLTRQLLTFSKGGAPVIKIDHLFPFVKETVQFALSGSNVSCYFDIPDNLRPSCFDKNQIGQVIDNIIINAQQAMPAGGTILLAARNAELAEKQHPILAKGSYVKISIKDTGIGIPREFLSRIFDPFFTTKSKGHGLGLATCYSIINRHAGCIDVESEQGKGATFHIYLPASAKSVSDMAATPDAEHKGSGTILLMDDEEIIRDTLGKMLLSLGYTVIYKNNGKEVLNFLMRETAVTPAIIAVILDLTVPGGMGGKETIAEIRKLNPDIPVFVFSGYADDPIMVNPVAYGFTASLCKPFTIPELSKMLGRYLKMNE